MGVPQIFKYGLLGQIDKQLSGKEDDNRDRIKAIEKRLAEQQRAAGVRMKKGGAVSASKRADGIAKKGKTKGQMR
jgi:hypothetical protein